MEFEKYLPYLAAEDEFDYKYIYRELFWGFPEKVPQRDINCINDARAYIVDNWHTVPRSWRRLVYYTPIKCDQHDLEYILDVFKGFRTRTPAAANFSRGAYNRLRNMGLLDAESGRIKIKYNKDMISILAYAIQNNRLSFDDIRSRYVKRQIKAELDKVGTCPLGLDPKCIDWPKYDYSLTDTMYVNRFGLEWRFRDLKPLLLVYGSATSEFSLNEGKTFLHTLYRFNLKWEKKHRGRKRLNYPKVTERISITRPYSDFRRIFFFRDEDMRGIHKSVEFQTPLNSDIIKWMIKNLKKGIYATDS